jgi:hypothetical protein
MIDGKEFHVDVAYAMHEESVLASVGLHIGSNLRMSRSVIEHRKMPLRHVGTDINRAAKRAMEYLYGDILERLSHMERSGAYWSHEYLVSQVRELRSYVESACDVDVVTTEVAEEIVQAVKTMGGGKR